MIKEHPLFSILVPVYNTEKYLDKCLNSVLSQTYSDFEIIVVDDGATDNSAEICDRFSNLYPDKIRVIHQENRGLIMARRAAIKDARGQYFVFLDSDDFLDSSALEVLKATIDEHKADLVIYCFREIDNNGIVFESIADEFPEGFVTKEDLIMKICSVSSLNAIWRKACKREALNNFDGYAEYGSNHGEDLFLSLPIIMNSDKIYFTNKVLYYYRVNPQGLTKTFNFDKFKILRDLRFHLLQQLRVLGIDTKDNLSVFFDYFAELAIGDIISIITSNYARASKMAALKEIADYTLIKQLPYYKYSGIRRRKLVRHLFIKEYYMLLINVGILIRKINKKR